MATVSTQQVLAQAMASTSVKTYICERCRGEFACVHPVDILRKYCRDCSPLARRKTKAEYQQTPEGRAASAKASAKYKQTPGGKTALAKICAKRRERSTDPDSYVARVELLHIMQERCIKCQATYKTTHQIDHITALCLGGTDHWSNLQPLCTRCHRKKSVEDRRKFREMRSEVGG